MASSSTSLFIPIHRPATAPRRDPAIPLPTRRQSLLLLLSSPAASLLAAPLPSLAADIPLFGIRRKFEKAEEAVKEAAVEIAKEGAAAVEEIAKEGAAAAEGIVKEGEAAVEKEVEAAAAEIGGTLGFSAAGDLVQAGAVAGAEAVGVLLGISVVNGILATEGDKL